MKVRAFQSLSAIILLFLLMGSSLLASQTNNAMVSFGGVWTAEKVVVRKTKPNRVVAAKRPATVKSPLLALQWRVLNEGKDGKPQAIDSATPFKTGERFQFEFTVNQNGYLYIMQNTEDGDGQVIFPNPNINNGDNYVKKDVKYTVPANCSENFSENSGNCWLAFDNTIPKDGKEAVTVIFSREKITTLPNSNEEVNKLAEHMVKKQTISTLRNDSPTATSYNYKQLKGLSAKQQFVTVVTNQNVKDNEELVATFNLMHVPAAGR
jgi:hypothetical protein